MTIRRDALFPSRRAIAVSIRRTLAVSCVCPKDLRGKCLDIDKLERASMKKLIFGFILVVYVAGFSTLVGATNYHEYRKFDASCPTGTVRCGCAESHSPSICCYYVQACSCTGNVPRCRSGLRR
jgi:hypothetical protein